MCFFFFLSSLFCFKRFIKLKKPGVKWTLTLFQFLRTQKNHRFCFSAKFVIHFSLKQVFFSVSLNRFEVASKKKYIFNESWVIQCDIDTLQSFILGFHIFTLTRQTDKITRENNTQATVSLVKYTFRLSTQRKRNSFVKYKQLPEFSFVEWVSFFIRAFYFSSLEKFCNLVK